MESCPVSGLWKIRRKEGESGDKAFWGSFSFLLSFDIILYLSNKVLYL